MTLSATLAVPAPRFKRGDLLRLRPGVDHPDGRYDLIVWVKDVTFSGTWRFNPETEPSLAVSSIKGPLYAVVVQGGVSGSTMSPQELLRPGTFLAGLLEDGGHDALEAVTDWTKEIVSEDTADNIHERVLAWKILHPELFR